VAAHVLPQAYMDALARWCRENQVLLICDEIQAGFGRTGRLFGFEHYDIVPDLICCGKGISSSLPLSAVIGRSDVMDLYGPAEMTSTHTGNPVCAVAALASIRKIVEGGLVGHAHAMGQFSWRASGILRALSPAYRYCAGPRARSRRARRQGRDQGTGWRPCVRHRREGLPERASPLCAGGLWRRHGSRSVRRSSLRPRRSATARGPFANPSRRRRRS